MLSNAAAWPLRTSHHVTPRRSGASTAAIHVGGSDGLAAVWADPSFAAEQDIAEELLALHLATNKVGAACVQPTSPGGGGKGLLRAGCILRGQAGRAGLQDRPQACGLDSCQVDANVRGQGRRE